AGGRIGFPQTRIRISSSTAEGRGGRFAGLAWSRAGFADEEHSGQIPANDLVHRAFSLGIRFRSHHVPVAIRDYAEYGFRGLPVDGYGGLQEGKPGLLCRSV